LRKKFQTPLERLNPLRKISGYAPVFRTENSSIWHLAKLRSNLLGVLGILGVVRKLRHAKNDFFEPSSTFLSQIFHRKENYCITVTNSSTPPSPLKCELICERPLKTWVRVPFVISYSEVHFFVEADFSTNSSSQGGGVLTTTLIRGVAESLPLSS